MRSRRVALAIRWRGWLALIWWLVSLRCRTIGLRGIVWVIVAGGERRAGVMRDWRTTLRRACPVARGRLSTITWGRVRGLRISRRLVVGLSVVTAILVVMISAAAPSSAVPTPSMTAAMVLLMPLVTLVLAVGRILRRGRCAGRRRRRRCVWVVAHLGLGPHVGPVVHTVAFDDCDGLSVCRHIGRREDCDGVWRSDARPGERVKKRNKV